MFVYTREAHPGEHVGHHVDVETKFANARLLRDDIGIRRDILVDDLEGTLHHAYGLLPNMTWVIDRGGRVVFKADWTSARNVEGFLERYAAAKAERPVAPASLGMYRTEQLEFRHLDRPAFYERLRANGPRSYAEFKRAEQLWSERA